MSNKDEMNFPFRKMTFTGAGQISVTPDLAVIRLGVQTTGDNVTTAQQENARISSQVLASIKQLGVTDIKTYQYQIEKLYDYENGQRIDRGYSVRNIFELRTGNIGQVGTIIDTAVANGANVVDFINFDIAEPEAYYQQALNLAVKNAIQKAKNVAMSIRIMFEPVPILITENTIPPTPYPPTFAARGEIAYTTPVESGSKQITASVTVEFTF